MSLFKGLLRLGKYLLIALLAVILASNVWTLATAKTPGASPAVLGFSTAVVVSGSMAPSIAVDDLIVIRAQKTYAVGDVITFSTGKALPVTHRIVAIDQDGSFVTKGDANNATDLEPVQPGQVAGKVILVLAKGGQVIGFLRSPMGLLAITLVLFSVLLLPDKPKGSQ